MPLLFKRIRDWAKTITSFRTGDVIAVDGPNGTANMGKDDLLRETAQNAFNFSKEKDFFATKQSLTSEITRAIARENEIESLFVMPTEEAVADWLEAHPEATTTVLDNSLTYKKLVIGTLNFVTPEMFGAIGDGVSDDTDAINNMLSGGNKFCFFKSSHTYKVSGILEVDSNTIVELNGCNVSSTYNGHIFRFKGVSAENHKSKFAIRNGTIIGSGLDNHVGDQGAAIQGFYADNIIIENIKTDHTYGDGLQFRETNNVRVSSCKIENFGRNGISPTSGSFMFEDIEVKGSLVGANPANPFDCEPNTATEPTRLIVRDSKLPKATLVDFHSAENDKFIIDALIENVDFTGAYPDLKIVKSRKGNASNVVIRNCNFLVTSDSQGLWLENVLNVTLEGCKFRYVENAANNTHAINVASDNVSLKIKDVNCAGLRRAVFAYNRDIVGWVFDGFKGSIYTQVFQNNELKNSDISGFETTTSNTSENSGNICVGCSIPESLRQFVTFGNGSSSFGGLIASNEFVRTESGAFDVFIPLPSIDETKGHCYFLSIGYSHRGRTNLSGQKLVSVLAKENYAGVTLTDVFATGDKTITISQSPGKRGLVASFEATNMPVMVSYTLFG